MVVIFTIALVVYPKQGFDAGIAGLKVFWDIVFPSLLPFFILSELMLGLGIVRGFGVLLEPLMRPLFSVPGIGAFALSMGLAAGYPMDAVITARFRETKMCTRIEGERLLAFTNTADPLFMFGAVAVGMLKSPALGALLAIAHYISAFLVGVGFKLWGRGQEMTPREPRSSRRENILKRAFTEMLKAHEEDGRPFGKLLGNAVTESVQTLLMILGFIVFFSVLIEILRLSGMMKVLGWPIALVYHLFGIHTGLVNPTLAGLLEIDIGSAQAAAVTAAPLLQKLALISGIIAWSGLAVHAQVASVLTETDIRMTPYFIARFLHAALAAVLTVLLWGLGMGQTAVHVVSSIVPVFAATSQAASGAPWWHVMWTGLSTWAWLIGSLLALSFVVYIVRRVRIIAWKARLNRI
uniref:sporulation integral membrane protein YlbJ n=1 Tax=Alicyclobacillus tolerans TaxID=90970 RepID=UPI003558B704